MVLERKDVVVVSLFMGAKFGNVSMRFSQLHAVNARLRVRFLQEYK